ncbi:MAG TPA: bifunctional acetate--CoA ligase family protein/GNAT family N-acetyltransferase [Nitrospiria bacterium]|nr:bifunctional acetate--CoA ligase family protein/GNAT family N-acetyltransferase [Nitrospiria bacterium]
MNKRMKPDFSPSHDVWGFERHPLDVFFNPQTVAVIGATERPGSVGRTVLWNLISSPFGGTVFPIHLKGSSVLGVKAYPNVSALPEPVDLAVIATPAPTVPALVGECAEAGVRGAIVISAGFKETGPAGVELEREIVKRLGRGKMRLIGPNVLGVMSPVTGLNATFCRTMARPGKVGFISQSGALCTAILDWSLRENVGFSAFVSIGSMLDVGWGDLIDHLGNDPHTQSILIYMESIGDARSFLSAAREVALTKPIIVIKTGRTEAGAKAASSHTGSLTGSDAVFDAAFRRSGVLRVDEIADLFFMAEVLAKQPRPKGPRLMIVTNAGGPGALAADALTAGGGELAELSRETIESLGAVLPPHWSRGNPIDVLGDAPPERYVQAVEIAAKDPHADGLLVILAPQSMTDPTRTAEQLNACAKVDRGPILASWMGGNEVAAGETALNQAGIPTFPYPDAAANVFNAMWRYSDNLRGLYETPILSVEDEGVFDRGRTEKIIKTAQAAGRTLLTEIESKQLLAAYGIPTIETRAAGSEEEAVKIARGIGYPVVLKVFSETITHKTDVGGVRLDLGGPDAVRRAYREIEASVRDKAGSGAFRGATVQPMIRLEGYEVILGSSLDPQFGPVLLFGTGGQLVEILKDHALALPPLNTTLARRMMERTRIFAALKGVRGRPPVDLPALEKLLVRFGQLIVEQRRIRDIEINPLLVSPERLVALDARVVVHPPGSDETNGPKLAIRPYPLHYVASWRMKDGTPVTFRPIRPEDEPLMVKFHQSLSEQTVYLRYFQVLKLNQRIAHERLTRTCFIDYDRTMVLVVLREDPKTGGREIIGASRLSRQPGTDEAEFSILVSDPFQRRGLGTELLRRILDIGRREKVRRVTADILPDNLAMQHVCKALGFRFHHAVGDPLVQAEIEL